MFSEKKVELTEGEKLFLDNIYDLIPMDAMGVASFGIPSWA